jgi:hypothetical protein
MNLLPPVWGFLQHSHQSHGTLLLLVIDRSSRSRDLLPVQAGGDVWVLTGEPETGFMFCTYGADCLVLCVASSTLRSQLNVGA